MRHFLVALLTTVVLAGPAQSPAATFGYETTPTTEYILLGRWDINGDGKKDEVTYKPLISEYFPNQWISVRFRYPNGTSKEVRYNITDYGDLDFTLGWVSAVHSIEHSNGLTDWGIVFKRPDPDPEGDYKYKVLDITHAEDIAQQAVPGGRKVTSSLVKMGHRAWINIGNERFDTANTVREVEYYDIRPGWVEEFYNPGEAFAYQEWASGWYDGFSPPEHQFSCYEAGSNRGVSCGRILWCWQPGGQNEPFCSDQQSKNFNNDPNGIPIWMSKVRVNFKLSCGFSKDVVVTVGGNRKIKFRMTSYCGAPEPIRPRQ